MKQAFATTPQTPTPVSRMQFTHRRATAFGVEYQTTDQHTVTVNGQTSTCSCGMGKYSVVCAHRLAALSQEKAYTEQAKARASYCAEFAIY